MTELTSKNSSNAGMSGSGSSKSNSNSGSGTQCSAEERSENDIVKSSADERDVVDNSALTDVEESTSSHEGKKTSVQSNEGEGTIMIVADQKSDYEIARQNSINRRRAGYFEHQHSITQPYVIPPGHVWLAGDNIFNSTDSR